MKRRTGFTLIELLVVVAIIAVLISILLPAINRAREQARLVACQSNERQIGTAMLMYADDFNGFIPAPQSPGYHLIWDWAIEPYIKAGKPITGHRGIWACPADITPDKPVPKGSPRIYEKRSYTRIAYAYDAKGNWLGSQPGSGDWIEKYYTLDRLTREQGATKLALASEVQDKQNVRYVDNAMGAGWGSYLSADIVQYGHWQGAAFIVGAYHNEGQNYVMADGHVVWIHRYIAMGGSAITWYP